MKVFISQLMKDKTTQQIEEERQKAVDYWTSRGYEVIDSVIKEEPDENVNKGIWYLSKSLELLATADLAYFMEDWEKGRGCRIERLVAEDYDIDIIEEGADI